MKEMSLFINGIEVAGIRNNNFLLGVYDGAMRIVNKNEFTKGLEVYREICENTWNDDLKRKWKEMQEYIQAI